jgi:hypothetical protein
VCSSDLDELEYFSNVPLELQKYYGTMAKSMALNADSLKGFTRYYDISFKGLNTDKERSDKILETMDIYARDMLTTNYGNIGRFSRDLGDGEKEDVLDTFKRLSASSILFDAYNTTAGLNPLRAKDLTEYVEENPAYKEFRLMGSSYR